jgi:hypothetical protein
MPAQQVVENAQQIVENTSIIYDLQAWASIAFPVIGIIAGVFTWAWGRMQKGIDDVVDTLATHSERNEDLFDKLFTEQREMAEKLNSMYGEHNAIHGKLKTGGGPCGEQPTH